MKQIFITFNRNNEIKYEKQLDQITLSMRQAGIKRYLPMYEKDNKIWMYFYGEDSDVLVLKLIEPNVAQTKNPKFFS